MTAVYSALRSPIRPVPGSISRIARIPRAVFDFTSGVLDPRITFSRADAANCATYFGRDGLLRISPLNVQPYSHDLTNVGWGGNNLTRAAGTLTRASAAASCFGSSPAFATPLTPGQVFTCVAEVKAKAVGGAFGLRPSGTYPDRCDGLFNLLTGAAIGVGSVGGFSGAASSIYGPDADGYYTCVVSGTVGTTNLTNIIFGPCETSATYTAWEATSAVLSDCYVRAIGLIPYRTLTAQQVVDLGGLPKAAAAASSGPRFDYDPATPIGTTGSDLASGVVFSAYNASLSGTSISQPISATSTVAGNFGFSKTGLVGVGKAYTVTVSWTGNTAGRKLTFDDGQGILNTQLQSTAPSGSLTGTFMAYAAMFYCYASNGQIGDAFTVTSLIVKESTFTPRGLLIEETRTNLLLNSRDLSQASWGKIGCTAPRNQIGADGVANSASKITEDSSTGQHMVQQNVTGGTAQFLACGFSLKAAERTWAIVQIKNSDNSVDNYQWINLTTGALGTKNGTAIFSVTNGGGGWWRVTVPANLTATGTYQVNVYASSGDGVVSYAGTAGNGIIVDCAQLEVGSFATSPIVTGAATATRAKDVALVTGSNFSSWFNASEGTFSASISCDGVTGAGSIIVGSSAAANYYVGPSRVISYFNGSANNGTVNALTFGADAKTSLAYAASGTAVCLAGSTVATNAGQLQAMTQIGIGISFDQALSLNGRIKRLTYYPTRLPNATLQALST